VKPVPVEDDPAVDALAIDFPGFGAGASARMVRASIATEPWTTTPTGGWRRSSS
jgi:hypothetical protein